MFLVFLTLLGHVARGELKERECAFHRGVRIPGQGFCRGWGWIIKQDDEHQAKKDE